MTPNKGVQFMLKPIIGLNADFVNSSGDKPAFTFVATAEAFFSPEGEPDYWTRIERWAAASSQLFASYPDDREVRALRQERHEESNRIPSICAFRRDAGACPRVDRGCGLLRAFAVRYLA